MARLRRGVDGALVLDADGLAKLVIGNLAVRSRFELAKRYQRRIVTAASTLAEVLRGADADSEMHRVLKHVEVVGIDKEFGRAAGELLGRTGLRGHRCALDALLAVVALAQPRPVLLLTSDPADLRTLTQEPGRPKAEQVAVVAI